MAETFTTQTRHGQVRRTRKLSPEQVREICRRWEAGETITELGVAYGVTGGAIYYRLSQHIVTYRRKHSELAKHRS